MEGNFEGCFGIPATVVGTREWAELESRENNLGPDQLLEEIINQKTWSNAEIMWIIKKMIFYYGKKDSLLQKAPTDRLFMNMVDVLRAFFLIFDISNPEIDENMRSYICAKLGDATWGINNRTREYLYKIKK